MQENALLQWLQVQATDVDRVHTGIGDDAAVLGAGKSNLVVTTDLISDGTHFLSESASAAQIGHKALAVNLSDIAAMAARPVAAFVSLLLPSAATDSYARELMTSMIDLGKEFDCCVAGGDTNTWDGKLAINVVVIGETTEHGPLLRSTAMPGDCLVVTGSLGGSIAGRHLDFSPRVREAMVLHDRYEVHAGMDLSDGLAMDVRRLCQQSDCGAELHLNALPISDAAQTMSSSKAEATNRALGDGEDFELLLAVSPDSAEEMVRDQVLDVPLTIVGRCLPNYTVDGEANIWQVTGDQRARLPNLGFEHGGKR